MTDGRLACRLTGIRLPTAWSPLPTSLSVAGTKWLPVQQAHITTIAVQTGSSSLVILNLTDTITQAVVMAAPIKIILTTDPSLPRPIMASCPAAIPCWTAPSTRSTTPRSWSARWGIIFQDWGMMILIFKIFWYYRERVVHLLAVRPLKKPELYDRMARGKILRIEETSCGLVDIPLDMQILAFSQASFKPSKLSLFSKPLTCATRLVLLALLKVLWLLCLKQLGKNKIDELNFLFRRLLLFGRDKKYTYVEISTVHNLWFRKKKKY